MVDRAYTNFITTYRKIVKSIPFYHIFIENEAPQEHPASACGLFIILKAARINSVW